MLNKIQIIKKIYIRIMQKNDNPKTTNVMKILVLWSEGPMNLQHHFGPPCVINRALIDCFLNFA